jgi:uncharacterized protein YqgC (DUF456 family)
VSWEQVIGLSLALVLMLVGLIGSIVPGLPGAPLVLAVAIGHRWYFGVAGVNNFVLSVLVALTVVSVVFDFLATALGAKKFGATWRGALGAVIGGVIGLFFALPGVLLGPFLGATLLEMVGGREFKTAAKAGAGAMVGLLLGIVGKFSICVVMMILFATNVVLRSVN